MIERPLVILGQSSSSMSDEKKAMKLDEIRSRWHIYFVSAAIGTAVIILFGAVDRQSMNLAAQNPNL